MKKWLGILLTASLVACGGEKVEKSANQITSNDFESMEGWLGDTPSPSLTKEKAHSGAYSVLVRPGLDYGLGYRNILGKMSPSRPEKISISAWVFLPNAQAAAKLVTEITDPARAANNQLLWQGIDLDKEVKKYNEWQHVEQVITLPATATATSRFQVYLWRAASGEPVYLDDLTISAAGDTK